MTLVSQTDLSIPLVSEAITADPSVLYRAAEAITLPPDEDMAAFRDLVIGAQSGKVQVSESVSEYIQKDFVNERQENPAVTSADLIRRMTIAKWVNRLVTTFYPLIP